MVKFCKGNILDSGADVICHQVNCQHKMNSGVPFDELSPLEQQIVKALSTGEKNEDELLESCSGGVDELIPTLTGLTFSGIIKQLPGSVYALDPLQTNIVY